jgi:hypothetical protein
MPTLTTLLPYSITDTSFIGGGYSISGTSTSITKGIIMTTDPSFTTGLTTHTYTGTGATIPTAFYQTISGLSAGTTYYIAAYMIDGSTRYRGNIYSLTTLASGATPGQCYTSTVTITPDMVYVLPKGSTIVSADSIDGLDSSCLDISLIPIV